MSAMTDMSADSLQNDLYCPITLELFREPVLAEDNHTYEKDAIEEWIRKGRTSQFTGQQLTVTGLHPNHMVQARVRAFEEFIEKKDYQLTLGVDVIKKVEQPLLQRFGKTIYRAEWILNNEHLPQIILLKIGGAHAKKEVSFYVNLSRNRNIVRTFGFVNGTDSIDQNNSVLLLQEYVPHTNLHQLLSQRRTVPDEKILIQIFLQIVEGMIHLASKKVVHGDLTCRNVLVFRFNETDPEKNIVKITDFGLNQHSELYSSAPNSAQTAIKVVPIRYAPPELLVPNATSEFYTEKSDVYTMGVLMWEAYSRCMIPWANIALDEEVIQQVKSGILLVQPPTCSQPYWSIIIRTWSPLPQERPTFEELKRLLNEQYYRAGNSFVYYKVFYNI